MLLNGVYTIKLVPFLVFLALQFLRCSFFVVILVLFVALGPWDVLERGFHNKTRTFLVFLALQLLRCSFFVGILVLFVALGPWDALERGLHIKTRTFLFFLALQLLRFSFFVLILALFRVLQHPAEELMSIFRGNSRTYFSVFCNIRPKNFSV